MKPLTTRQLMLRVAEDVAPSLERALVKWADDPDMQRQVIRDYLFAAATGAVHSIKRRERRQRARGGA